MPQPTKKTLKLNPDGTFPRKYIGIDYGYDMGDATVNTFVTTSTTSTDPDFIPTPPKKKTWKDYRKDLFGYYLLYAVVIGTGTILIYLIKGIVWLVKHL